MIINVRLLILLCISISNIYPMELFNCCNRKKQNDNNAILPLYYRNNFLSEKRYAQYENAIKKRNVKAVEQLLNNEKPEDLSIPCTIQKNQLVKLAEHYTNESTISLSEIIMKDSLETCSLLGIAGLSWYSNEFYSFKPKYETFSSINQFWTQEQNAECFGENIFQITAIISTTLALKKLWHMKTNFTDTKKKLLSSSKKIHSLLSESIMKEKTS